MDIVTFAVMAIFVSIILFSPEKWWLWGEKKMENLLGFKEISSEKRLKILEMIAETEELKNDEKKGITNTERMYKLQCLEEEISRML